MLRCDPFLGHSSVNNLFNMGGFDESNPYRRIKSFSRPFFCSSKCQMLRRDPFLFIHYKFIKNWCFFITFRYLWIPASAGMTVYNFFFNNPNRIHLSRCNYCSSRINFYPLIYRSKIKACFFHFLLRDIFPVFTVELNLRPIIINKILKLLLHLISLIICDNPAAFL